MAHSHRAIESPQMRTQFALCILRLGDCDATAKKRIRARRIINHTGRHLARHRVDAPPGCPSSTISRSVSVPGRRRSTLPTAAGNTPRPGAPGSRRCIRRPRRPRQDAKHHVGHGEQRRVAGQPRLPGELYVDAAVAHLFQRLRRIDSGGLRVEQGLAAADTCPSRSAVSRMARPGALLALGPDRQRVAGDRRSAAAPARKRSRSSHCSTSSTAGWT